MVLGALMRPPFNYAGAIMTPSEAGMSSDGSALTSNLTKLGVYFTSGFVDANATVIQGKDRNALGDRYFVATGGMCTDVDSGDKVSRSMYLNFMPVKAGKSSTGLLPGMAKDIANVTFFAKQTAMAPFSDAYPPCKTVTLKTNDTNNIPKLEDAYVSVAEICKIDPKLFESGARPAGICTEGFDGKMPDDTLSKVYLSAVTLLFLYVAMKAIAKTR